MSLGRVGLVGELGRRTTANLVFYGNVTTNVGNAGTTFGKLSGGNDFGTAAGRYDDVMPYAGSFKKFLYKSDNLWRGVITLQKNGVDTIFTLSFDPPSAAIKSIKGNIPFVAGDVFRFKYVTTGIGGFRSQYWTLFGGLNVTN